MGERSGWTGDWLSGPRGPRGPQDDLPPQQWRGQRLGLPQHGLGSVAPFGRRLVAIFVDWIPCTVVAQTLTSNPAWSSLMLFALVTVVGVATTGRSPGHWALGLHVASVETGARPTLTATFVRTALLCLGVPALLMNEDGRGWHDRAARTVVLRTR